MSSSLTSHIVVTGIKQPHDIVGNELEQKGYVICSHDVNKKTMVSSYMLALNVDLVMHLAIELDINIKKSFDEYTAGQQLTILNKAISDLLDNVVLKSGGKTAIQGGIMYEKPKLADLSGWVVHNDALLQTINETKHESDAKTTKITEYYGSQIGFYFSFLHFYTILLFVPAVFGLLLFVYDIFDSVRNTDSIYLPVYCIFMAIWATFFLSIWKRKCSVLSYKWKVADCEVQELDQELNKLADLEYSVTDEVILVFRNAISFFGMLVIAAIIFIVMLFYFDIEKNVESYFGFNIAFSSYIPKVLYSLIPIILNSAFDPICVLLNEFECHPTKAYADDALVLKKFAVQFMNRYCALLYIAFWLQDLERLKALLISLLTVSALINNVTEIASPLISVWRQKSKNTKFKASTTTTTMSSTTGSIDQQQQLHKINQIELDEILAKELTRPIYNLDDDYLEMVLQYGYLALFAVVFPLAPAFAFLNNLFEGKLDLLKLSQCRRPAELKRSNIGAWQNCLEFISFFGVITNCYLVAMVSTKLHLYFKVPDMFGGDSKTLDSEEQRVISMLLLDHLILGFKVAFMFIIDDTSRWVRISLAKERTVLYYNKLIARKMHQQMVFDTMKLNTQQQQMQCNDKNDTWTHASIHRGNSSNSGIKKYANQKALNTKSGFWNYFSFGKTD